MIYTFYSYKGGVGRSMALANVAKSMSMLGRRVVMVDWDLEAPGLETFFYQSPEDLEGVRTAFGVLDLLLAYKEEFPQLVAGALPDEDPPSVLARSLTPISRRLIPVVPPETDEGGGVWLLPAGWRAGARFDHYARMVQSFDWEEFYAEYWGAVYFDWLRAQLTAPEVAHDVLIDSRTGITEMGGVCTRQLADVVVSFCAPNQQNLDGVVSMSQSFVRRDLLEARGRPLQVVVVPTRIDNSENDRRLAFERMFRERLDEYTPVAFRGVNHSFWDLKIPYIPKYAYQEALAVGAPDPAEELVEAYQRLTSHLLLLADETAPRSVWSSAPVWSVPFSRDPNFVDRVQELQAIEESLTGGDRDVAIVTVTGPRAVGKTALAAHYAHTHRADFDVVWWLRAKDPTALAHDIRTLASAIDVPIGTDDQATAAAVRRWLERSARWLLIVDDAAAPAAVEWFLPTAGAGQVLVVSTTSTGWRRFGGVVEVPLLPTDAGVEFLARRTGLEAGDDLRMLAGILGGLPLGLELAAAHLEESGTSPADFVAALGDPASPASQSQAPLLAVLREALFEGAPGGSAVVALLHLYAQLDAGGVPVELLQAPDRPERDTAIRQLRQSGLAREEGGKLVVHPLVPTAAGVGPDSPFTKVWAEGAMRQLDGAFPSDVEAPERREACLRLVPHVLAAARRAPQAQDARRVLLPRAARFLRIEGRLAEAQEALDLTPGSIGSGQPVEVVIEKGLLAFEQGQLNEAVKVFEGLAASTAPDSPAAVQAWTHLGVCQRFLADEDRALVTLRRAVDVSSALGSDLLLADALVERGATQMSKGAQEASRADLEHALQLRERILGPDHPKVGIVRVQLGHAMSDSGQVIAAHQAINQGLAILQTAYGSNHVAVASGLFWMAGNLIRAFQPEAAITYIERLLAIEEPLRRRALAPLGATLTLLGMARRDLGEESHARAALGRAIATLSLGLGADHPSTRLARSTLDSLVPTLDRRRRAEDATRRCRPADLRLLVDEGEMRDGEKAFRLLDVARLLRALDRPGSARRLLEDRLASATDDGRALLELGYVLSDLGDTAGAEARLRQAAEVLRGQEGALHSVGSIDKLRWRVRWESLPDPQQAAVDWVDLAIQAHTSFTGAFRQDPSNFLAGVEAMGLAVVLARLNVAVEAPRGFVGEVKASIETARRPATFAPQPTDRERVRWTRALVAQAELALILGDLDQAARLYRNFAADESLRLLELDAAYEQLSLYLRFGVYPSVCQVAIAVLEEARPLVAPVKPGRFDEVVVVVGNGEPDESAGPPVPKDSPDQLLVCAGVSAADILMAEAALASGSPTVRLLLPSDIAGAKAEVTMRAGPQLVSRFEALLPRCEVFVQGDRLGPVPDGADPYERSQLWSIYEGWANAEPGHLTIVFHGEPSPALMDAASWTGATVVRGDL